MTIQPENKLETEEPEYKKDRNLSEMEKAIALIFNQGVRRREQDQRGFGNRR